MKCVGCKKKRPGWDCVNGRCSRCRTKPPAPPAPPTPAPPTTAGSLNAARLLYEARDVAFTFFGC